MHKSMSTLASDLVREIRRRLVFIARYQGNSKRYLIFEFQLRNT